MFAQFHRDNRELLTMLLEDWPEWDEPEVAGLVNDLLEQYPDMRPRVA